MVVLLDQGGPAAVAIEPHDRVELPVVVRAHDQARVVGGPAGHLVVGALAGIGQCARSGGVGDDDRGRGRLEADHGDGDCQVVVRHDGRADIPPAVVDDAVLAGEQVTDHDVHVDAVAAVRAVDDRGLGDVQEHVEVAGIRHHRHECLRADRRRRQLEEVEQRELVVLVTSLVVLHHDLPTTVDVASPAARRQRGQRRDRSVRCDLDQLLAAEVVVTGQHVALRAQVEREPRPGVQQGAKEVRG